MRLIAAILVITFFGSCQRESVYKFKATNTCSNLELYALRLFPNEEIQLKLDGELILRERITDSVKGFRFLRKFCLPYQQKFTLSIKTTCDGKTYIDTTLEGYKHKNGYHLNISMPYPYNWKEYFVKGKFEPIRKWGYLPIDSCIRFVSLVSDSAYKGTVVCGLKNNSSAN